MFCKNCGESLNENQAICLRCGVSAGVGNSFCFNCGNPTAPGAAVCLNCGVALQQPAAATNNLAGQDKITMALVCFFIGGLGIHNFMMGEKKKGITRIVLSLCLGLGGIVALIDLIKILTDKYKVDTEAFF